MHPNMMSLNDLGIQNHLFDRRWVYKLCDDHGIPTPRHVFCNRGEDLRGTIMDGMVPTDDFPTPWPSSELEVGTLLQVHQPTLLRCRRAGSLRARKGRTGRKGD
jgi:hypothetical protein